MVKKITGFLLLFIILQSCDTHAQTFNKAKMDSFFVALNMRDQSMGSIAISVNGVPVYQNAIGYGQINGQTKTPATVNTEYRVGSISKMFTAVMILQLIEEGKLKLETPLAAYYPQLPNAAKITIAQMLSHHSGLHNFTNDSVYIRYMTKPKSEAEMLEIFTRQKPDFEPDTKFEYSNTNFVLLGYIIEKLTRKSYAEELDTRITKKIGLGNTYYGSKINPAKNEAYSYNYGGKWVPAFETDMSIPAGAGAIVSTPTDLVKFINALFAGQLISPANLTLMKTIRDKYGMAMYTMPFYDKTGYGHGGDIDGFHSMLTYFPQEKVAIAYTSNGVRYSNNDLLIGVLSIYFNKPYTIPEFKTVTLSEAELDQCLGNYSSTQVPVKFIITKNNNMLFAQPTGQFAAALEAKGNNQFVFATAGVSFQFEPAKKTFTYTQAGRTYLFTKDK